jgi:hypothetical protein
MKESSIQHEAGRYWVLDHKTGYSVMASGITHSIADSTYARTPDGLSIAIARANYLAKAKP